SQEPRRPRFSFFNLHNVKELTHRLQTGHVILEAKLPEFLETKPSIRLPGRSSALSETAKQWEQQVLGVVSVRGF
ncbi:hypothetical protein, partial [Devosia sp. WQ 349K1]|uniref:hypothetical protein n=1 Tax=Devosia sp. WQ 349K1 TaxID=2800329 RepID=UPI001AEF198B